MPTPRRFALLVLCLTALLLPPAAPARAQAADNGLRQSIVKIHSTVRNPDLFRPWTKAAAQQATGSGVVISDKRIITNAHVVRYASQVYIQPYQSADRLPAKVDSISHAMDLAILKLEDESFFDNHPALGFYDGLPDVKQQVNAYGYPQGGEELSITEGIVSRIEVGPYNQGEIGLIIQIDAALNPGNSGGAAIIDGKIAGIVRANIPTAENIGYLIPVEEVHTFLADVKDGAYGGKYKIEAGMQTTENPALRAKLGLPDDVTGLMVTRAKDDDSLLQAWDVVTHIAGHDIHNDGNVKLTDDLRVDFRYYIDSECTQGKLPLTVFRGGETVQIELPVKRQTDKLLPSLGGDYPRYYIYGPLCFTQVTSEMVGSLPAGFRNALLFAGSPMMTRATDEKQSPDEELVAVSTPMFPHRITKGYDNPLLAVVTEANGKQVKHLRGLVEICEQSTDKHVVLKFAGDVREHIVFDRTELLDAMDSILTDNGIRHRASEDLRGLLNDAE